MTQSNQTPDDGLDDLFATARQAVPAPSAALVERIVDAAQQQSAVYSQPKNNPSHCRGGVSFGVILAACHPWSG